MQAAPSRRAKKIISVIRGLKLVIFDFDGVFTDNRVLVSEEGRESVLCWRSDGFGLQALKSLGIQVLVLSQEKNPVVRARCLKLKIPCITGCDRKVEAIASLLKRKKMQWKEIAYLGNDLNDLECLKHVGLPACVADAYPTIKSAALYVTKTSGGKGAVREFCELIADEIREK